LLIVAALACKKKADGPSAEEEIPPAPADTGLGCRDLPAAPQPFGWTDTTFDPNQNITAFVMNPLNPDEAIIVVEGDIFGYNKLYAHHIPTRNSKYLGTVGEFPPQVNSNGWVLFSSSDNDVFKVKVNGDSLTQMTNNKRSMDPHWDYSGRIFYYYEDAFATVRPYIVKRYASGTFLNQVDAYMPRIASYRKSDRILLMKNKDTSVTVIEKIMGAKDYGVERAILTASFAPGAPVHFDDLTVDCNDEYMYWTNAKGIYRCRLTGGSPELVAKNCGNYTFLNPLIVPYAPDELTVACHFRRPLNAMRLYHEYRPYQMNLATREFRWLKIFN
jgi:hypothetical protein